jgi:hypothetical protein
LRREVTNRKAAMKMGVKKMRIPTTASKVFMLVTLSFPPKRTVRCEPETVLFGGVVIHAVRVSGYLVLLFVRGLV